MNSQSTLFPLPEIPQKKIKKNHRGVPRLNKPCRNQIQIVTKSLDEIIPQDHLARKVWCYVKQLDLSLVLGKIQAVEGNVGRPATDPNILLALWLFATVKSIGSARMIAEYCNEHDAFKWICGGVMVNYHTLSNFRSQHGDQMRQLLVDSVAMLSKTGIISLEKVSQDGMKVRANAGSSSFRREETLKEHLYLAQKLLEDLDEEAKKHPSIFRKREKAAQRRAAKEREEQIAQALVELRKLREERAAAYKRDRKKPDIKRLENTRGSKTDPEARVMKMACGGYRPAYNVQFAATNKGKAIVGVKVTNEGNDACQLVSMMKEVSELHNYRVKKWIVDSGYYSKSEIQKAKELFESSELIMPAKEKKKENEAEKELRERMEKEEAKTLYSERAETAEHVNAQSRNRGMQQFLVRGMKKVTCVALLFAIAQNMMVSFNG